jgi:16S rRNA (adenine1518-N6/adenine1519-N6)-dimethyltransferase
MHKAKKRFGQNFLVDEHIINGIINAIRPEPHDNMVEIGPGLGALTKPLLEKLDLLHVVEIDRDIIARLESEFPPDSQTQKHKLIIHAGDALKFDFTTLPMPLRIVGNRPYNISTPLLFHFAAYAKRITDMHFMLQDEVVERMVAASSTPEFGRLSVMLQYRFRMEKIVDVPPQSFRPPPRVNSAIVRMVPFPASEVEVRNENLFAEIVASAFGQRRKTLRNTLKKYLAAVDFEKLGIDSQLRAENLDAANFAKISNYLSA